MAELARMPGASSSLLARRLVMDKGQLSRAVSALVSSNLVTVGSAGPDQRVRALWLTGQGEREAARLETMAAERAASLLAGINPKQHGELVAALSTADTILSAGMDQAPVVLGNPAPGDMGTLIARHGEVFSSEYGFDARYEAWVAKQIAAYVENANEGEQLWIARANSVFAGCIMLTGSDAKTGMLSLVLVEPEFRRQGIGQALVETALVFAGDAGYSTVEASAPAKLKAAHRLFARSGFGSDNSGVQNWAGQKIAAKGLVHRQ